MKIFRRLSILFCFALFALSTVGVYALWSYRDPPEPLDANGLIGLVGFYYDTVEVLPDDGKNDMNAFGFVDYAIYNTKAGLNSKKGNTIYSQVKAAGAGGLHSRDNITSSNFGHIFKETQSTELEFTMLYVSDTYMYLFVYADADIEYAATRIKAAQDAGETLTLRITTYITVVERSADGKLDWDDKGSAKGTAQVVKDGSLYVIDPASWMGTADPTQSEQP